MAKIPNPTLVSPRFNDVMLPQGAFGDSTRAIARLAQSVTGAADTVIKMGFEAQDLRNKTQAREKLRELREMHLSFQQEVTENNIDPAQWTPMWEARLKGFENSISSAKDMPQAVRDRVGTEFSDFAMESSFRIAGDALKENRQRAAKVYNYDINEAAKNMQWDAALGIVDQALEDGVIDPADAEIGRKSIINAKNLTDREMERESDPLSYLEKLNDPANPLGLSEPQKYEETQKAMVAKSQIARARVDEINDMVKGELIKDVDELKVQLEQYPEISDVDKAVIMKSFGKDSNVPLSYQERYGITDELTKNHQAFKRGEITAEEYTALYNETMTKVGAFGSRNGAGTLRERAYKVDPARFMNPDGTALTGEALREKMAKEKDVKSQVDAVIKERIDSVANIQRIADFGTSAPEDKKGRIIYEKAKTEQDEKNLRIRAVLEDKIGDWISDRENPPTLEETLEQLGKIQAQEIFNLFRSKPSDAGTPSRSETILGESSSNIKYDKKMSAPAPSGENSVPVPDASRMILPEVEEAEDYERWLNEPSVLPPLNR